MNGVSHTGAVSKGIIKWYVKNRVYQKRRNVKGDLLFTTIIAYLAIRKLFYLYRVMKEVY